MYVIFSVVFQKHPLVYNGLDFTRKSIIFINFPYTYIMHVIIMHTLTHTPTRHLQHCEIRDAPASSIPKSSETLSVLGSTQPL